VLVGPDPKLNELGLLARALTVEPPLIPISTATRAALMLTLRMGFRALEVCALEWRAINLDGIMPTATVTRSKTAAGKRSLPLPSAVSADLRNLKAAAGKDAKFVFPARAGSKRATHMHPESLSRAFARSCVSLGLAAASTHDLRRTCLSGLIELGHGAVAEKIAGHVPRSVLGQHYDRASRMEAMRAGLEAWSAAIDAAMIRERAELASAHALR
jgi:integrase